MSGGKALAECIAKELGSPCVGREILVTAAEKLGVPEQVLARKMERGPGLWDQLTLERRIYLVAVQAALAERPKHARHKRSDFLPSGHTWGLQVRDRNHP